MRRIIILIISCMVMAGCRSVEYVPVPKAVHDTVRMQTVKTDSIYVDRWHKEVVKGDTVLVHDSVLVNKWHYLHDSIYINKCDTVPVVVEKEKVIKEKKYPLLWWDIVSILAVAGFVGWKIYKKVKK